ncbi:NADH dehydrogenase (quinone) [Methylophaga lonarensis MPL]|uniref:NADH dehydrogenase (Quinone) n=1 Tax=Methylophaga lonarensis MPL TaxID=1286106 RepID=M7NZZ6_9GAMM|nr:monovalent cation/H+ antiporter subunit D [Methylophaga lonarensis]EMR12771.1 NADH dehydrogenase (quinone) [Methylophaga lonarensis MPL]
MMHLTALPVLLPLIGGFLLLFTGRNIQLQRQLHLALMLGLLIVSGLALQTALTGQYSLYQLGNWQPPFGIVLVLDRLSAMLVLLTTLLALGALVYAIATDTDHQGPHFHVLFQLQLFGLNGAFLTGDLFNLFVFFEVLLLASYGLLLHGGGRLRTRAGLHYVVINLIGSTLFLFAVGTLYGMLGTLNIADMAQRMAQLPAEDQGVVAAAGLLLLVVFGIKAAMFPLYLWLPAAYAQAPAAVAALFAIMTKVGLYAIIRVHGTVFGEQAGALAYIHSQWLLLLGMVTLALAALGVMASRGLREQVAYLVLASVATLLIAIGLNTAEALAASLYYLVHSTLIAGAMFLLADIISRSRAAMQDQFIPGPVLPNIILIGSVFMLIAIAMTGMPPLSGFFGKVMILHAALAHDWYAAIVAVILVSGLLMIISMARTGSLLFYKAHESHGEAGPASKPLAVAAVLALLTAAPLLVVFAQPFTAFTETTTAQLLNTQAYIEAVLSTAGDLP